MAGPIAVYGATGYTGRLVAAELVRRAGGVVLAGRNVDKLHAVADGLDADVTVRAAELDDRVALRHALGDCGAVVNCAGPFVRYGEPVLRAAVETGTHYVDTTGEQTFMRLVYERYDEAARAAEVAVIPGAGFDYLPGDFACRLAARDHEPLEEIVVGYWVKGFAATRGTMHSTLEILRSGGFEYRDGALCSASRRPRRAHVTFPAPIGRQAMIGYPSGEVLTVPRHTRTRTVTSLIAASTLVPAPVPAELVALSTPALSLTLHTPAKALADLAIDRLPEGPSESARRAARFTIVALARGEDGRSGRALVSGSDVYGLTAVTAAHCAVLLAEGDRGLAGAHSPASAFDAVEFLNYLGDHGVTFELDAVAAHAPA